MLRYAILGLLGLAMVPAAASAGDRVGSRVGFSVGFGYSQSSGGWGDRSSSHFGTSIRIGTDRYNHGHYNRYDYGRRDYGRHDWGQRYYYPAPVVVTPPPVYCPPAPPVYVGAHYGFAPIHNPLADRC